MKVHFDKSQITDKHLFKCYDYLWNVIMKRELEEKEANDKDNKNA